MENVTVFNHPLIQHKISLLRDKNTDTNEFRRLVEEIAQFRTANLPLRIPSGMFPHFPCANIVALVLY